MVPSRDLGYSEIKVIPDRSSGPAKEKKGTYIGIAWNNLMNSSYKFPCIKSMQKVRIKFKILFCYIT